MQRTSSRLFRGAFAAICLLALPRCVETTTSTATSTAPTEAATPATPAAPATPTTPISPHPTTTAVTPVATAPAAIPSVPATAAAPTTIPTAGAGSLVGTWESASCGARAYARNLTFADATTFTAQDLVSPCPKGATCVWSGIIARSGTYKTQKDIVTLVVDKASNGPAKTQFPPSLTLDASRAPVEAGSDGKPCPYKHVGGVKAP